MSQLGSHPLAEHLLAGSLAAVLGYVLFTGSKQAPEVLSGWMPNPVFATVVSAIGLNAALVLFRKRKPSEIIQAENVPIGDPRKPPTDVKGPVFLIDCTQEATIRYSKEGLLSEKETPAIIMPEVFDKVASFNPDAPALLVERPLPQKKSPTSAPSLPLEEWKMWTMSEYIQEGKDAAKGFIEHGLEVFGTVTVFGFNAPEWNISAVAAIFAGAKIAGIYPSDNKDNIHYKLHHSASKVAVVQGEDEFKKVVDCLKDLPDLTLIVTYLFENGDKVIKRPGLKDVIVVTWSNLVETGRRSTHLTAELQKRRDNMKPGHACALVYTSGTTGMPKAVMISHDNLVSASMLIYDSVFAKHRGSPKMNPARSISYLPLSHIAGMIADIWSPLVMAYKARGTMRAETYFARPYDLKEGTIVDRFTFVRPTVFLGVPRVWEKIAEKLKAIGRQNKGLKLKLSTWAKAKCLEHAMACEITGDGHYPFMYGAADFIMQIVRKKLGLNDCIYAACAAAPISREIVQYYGSLGIHILELYGMSESTGATTSNSDETNLMGSVGYSPSYFDNAVFHIDEKTGAKKEAKPADDVFNPSEEEQGEICFRGRHVMMGYMANMSYGKAHIEEMKKKNSETIDAEGWLHSGDKGTVGKNGMFRITGRYKELIITAGGENVAPVPIEDDIKANCPAISNLMMVGDKLKYNTILITLKAKGATGEFPGTNELIADAKDVNPKVKTTEEAMEDPIWKKYITDAITKTNNNAAVCVSNATKIQKFTILPRDFSIQTGEFTPTLKLKRSVVMQMYKEEIAKMY